MKTTMNICWCLFVIDCNCRWYKYAILCCNKH